MLCMYTCGRARTTYYALVRIDVHYSLSFFYLFSFISILMKKSAALKARVRVVEGKIKGELIFYLLPL